MLQRQWKKLSKVPHMAASGRWKPTMSKGRVVRIDAKNLKLAPGYAKVPKGPFNVPKAKPWKWIWLAQNSLTHPHGPPSYVRMHMLNGRLGGPGNTKENLVPGSASLNSHHSTHFEEPAIRILNKGYRIKDYWVRVRYNKNSKHLVTNAGQQAWRATVDEIWGGFTYINAMGQLKPGNFNAEEDPSSLAAHPNWTGH